MVESLALGCVFYRQVSDDAFWKFKFGLESKDILKSIKKYM